MKKTPNSGGGPRTRIGRDRSSQNAAKHGLLARGFLLRGESEADYERHLDEWLTSLRPTTPAEVQVIATLADLTWRQRRWFRIERAKQMEDVEMKIAKTSTMTNLSMNLRALTAVNALVDAVERTTPTSFAALSPFITAAGNVVTIVSDVNEPSPAATRLSDAVRSLDEGCEADWQQCFRRVGERGRELAADLSARIATGEQALEDLRQTLAATALPTEPDLKKLARYQATIQRAVEAQARILGHVREQVGKARKRRPVGSSFGAGSQPTVRLRVVR